MEIRLNDVHMLNQQTMAARGIYENPLTREEEEEKALDLIVPILGKKRSAALLSAQWDFESIKDVRTLRKLYSA